MGILIRQEKEKWIISVREQWKIQKNVGKFLEFHNFAESINMPYKVFFKDDSIFVTMKGTDIVLATSQQVYVIFSKLLAFKTDYGQLEPEKTFWRENRT